MDLILKTAKCEFCAGDLASQARMPDSNIPDAWSHVTQADRTKGGLHAAFPAPDTIELVK